MKTRNLPTVRCQDELATALRTAITSLKRILPAAVLPIVQAAMFLSRVFFNTTSVHVERMHRVPVPVFFSQVPVAALPEIPLVSSIAASQVAAFQAAANSSPKEFFPRQQNLTGRDPMAREECRYTTKQTGQCPSKAYRILQSWTRRCGRAELRSKNRLWSCELPRFTRQQ